MSITKNEQTVAATLMNGVGHTCMVTGSAVSTGASLYFMKYLTVYGTRVLEYLPHALSVGSEATFTSHMTNGNEVSVVGLTKVAGVLTGGVLIRKLGTILTNKKSVEFIERIIYGRKKSVAPVDHAK